MGPVLSFFHRGSKPWKFRLGGLQALQDLLMFRKTVLFLLGEDQLLIGHHFENTASRFNHLDFKSELFLDSLRQTGSLRIVVSLPAVFDRNLLSHRSSLPVSDMCLLISFQIESNVKSEREKNISPQGGGKFFQELDAVQRCCRILHLRPLL
jgi:hypothetical protein